jgi:hypothetical protein
LAERVEVTPDKKTKHLGWLTGAKAPFDAQRVFGKVANPPPDKKAPAGVTARAQVCEGSTPKKTSPRANTVRGRSQAAIAFADSFFTRPPNYYPWHSDHEHRRPKSLPELIEGHEPVELYDRRFPGRMRRASI